MYPFLINLLGHNVVTEFNPEWMGIRKCLSLEIILELHNGKLTIMNKSGNLIDINDYVPVEREQITINLAK